MQRSLLKKLSLSPLELSTKLWSHLNPHGVESLSDKWTALFLSLYLCILGCPCRSLAADNTLWFFIPFLLEVILSRLFFTRRLLKVWKLFLFLRELLLESRLFLFKHSCNIVANFWWSLKLLPIYFRFGSLFSSLIMKERTKGCLSLLFNWFFELETYELYLLCSLSLVSLTSETLPNI